jgi:SUF system NifU family Fe-S assembly protein
MDDLYRDYILEHYRRPHNFGILEDPDARFEGANPLCGDRITVMLGIRDGVVSEVAFTGRGCAISQASASLLTDEIKGKPVAEAALARMGAGSAVALSGAQQFGGDPRGRSAPAEEALKAYNPEQPRAPKGTGIGGQWVAAAMHDHINDIGAALDAVDPTARAQVTALQAKLAEARALHQASRPKDALAIITAITAEVTRLGHLPTEAELHLLAG